MATSVDVATLEEKAKACLSKKVDVPGAPLWHMQKVARKNSTENLKTLQDALDYLTCKARAKMDFTGDEKEFLKELYEAFWWGGRYKGYPEAAQLADHYVNGKGKTIKINSEVYKKSPIVKATSEAMKKYIKELHAKKLSIGAIKSSNVDFLRKAYAAPLLRMNFQTEGKLKANGVLEAGQNKDNARLKNTDNHFYLDSSTIRMPTGQMQTTWSVKSVYDFEPFEKQNYYTNIPLGKNTLVLYDGLSEYMTQVGIAKAFTYYSSWKEMWK